MKNQDHITQIQEYGAGHYHPLPIVIASALGCWMTDVEGTSYLDMLSAYSAVNQGHRHPKIIAAAKDQMDRVTLCSTAFNHDQGASLCKKLALLTGLEKTLLMNSGAEAVETAIKLARKWSAFVKKIPPGEAEIITFENNFHGRTTTVVSGSSNIKYKAPFGPLTPGFKIVPYDDIDALRKAITHNTAAILIEPIQGEGGINVPQPGYMTRVAQLCEKHNILLIADEIQTGLGRTGKMFACDHEGIKPDIMLLGKALSGGIYPISAVCSPHLHLFKVGEHGSTYGGNPLACAIAKAAIDVIEDEDLDTCADTMGRYLMQQLHKIKAPCIKDIRGKGLLIGLEIKEAYPKARFYCEKLMLEGILCKETNDNVIRFAPPLNISKTEIDGALPKIKHVLHHATH